jgi:hypothetical protein
LKQKFRKATKLLNVTEEKPQGDNAHSVFVS